MKLLFGLKIAQLAKYKMNKVICWIHKKALIMDIISFLRGSSTSVHSTADTTSESSSSRGEERDFCSSKQIRKLSLVIIILQVV